MNESERQSEYVFPKIYVGKATLISELEMEYLMDKLLDMGRGELKDMLVGIANRKVVESRQEMVI